MRVGFAFFVCVVAIAGIGAGCRESTPKPMPDPTPTVTAAPSPTPTSTSSPKPEIVCEPYVSCGVWRECTFFERVPVTGDTTSPPVPRWKATSGSMKGTFFLRSHQCWPADAGPSQCALYCSGPGPTDGTCVDGLISETQICTGTAVPHPSDVRCEVRDGQCMQVK